MRKIEGFQKGVNLGGWISQFNAYDRAHFDSFITEKDIRDIAGLGFDHVRVPVDYVLFEEEDGTPKEDGFYYLENCRRWCEECGLHMLIDLHECYGYSFDPLKKGMDRERFFYDPQLQERFLKLWRRIAERFCAWQEQIAFEPLNEVVLEKVADAWNKVASSYIRMMRTIVPDSYLVVGGVCYSSVSSVPLLELPLDPKIVYNFHCYEPFAFTHQGAYWVENMPRHFTRENPSSTSEAIYAPSNEPVDERDSSRRTRLYSVISSKIILRREHSSPRRPLSMVSSPPVGKCVNIMSTGLISHDSAHTGSPS